MNDKKLPKMLERYLENKRNEMKRKFNRVLPTGELLFNRFEKAVYLSCGEETSIYDTSVIMGDVQIGSHVWIGPYTTLEGINAKLCIGNYVTISAGVAIYTHDSTKHYLSPSESFSVGTVTIGDHTVIGTMSMIACNVSIADHCVIGAHSFVNKDIPAYSIAAGVPAKVIGRVLINDEGKVEFLYPDKNPNIERHF